MNETIVKILTDILYVIIIAVIPIISKYFIEWLQAKKEQIINETKDKNFSSTIDNAFSIVSLAVDLVQQTFVDSLKASGKFDKAAQKEAMKKCLEIVDLLMNSEIKDFINVTYGDSYSQIRATAESIIHNNKK